MTEETAVAKSAVAMSDRGIEITSLDEAYRFAQMVVRSGMAPNGFDRPESVMVAMEAGAAAGLRPMQALQSLYVVNGMPSWKGEAAAALIRRSGLASHFDMGCDGEGEAAVGWCELERRDQPGRKRVEFTVADAKKAGLWMKRGKNGKDTPWVTFPKRMLMWRAVGHAASMYFSDALCGFPIAENAAHYDRPRETVRVEPPKPSGPDPLLVSNKAPYQHEEPGTPSDAHYDEPEIDPETGEVIPDDVGRVEG